MKLYVCWTTANHPGGHPCHEAFAALGEAGHDPEVVKARSWGALPDFLQTSARRRVQQGTGEKWVPALELDNGEWIGGSEQIVEWAEAHPAGD